MTLDAPRPGRRAWLTFAIAAAACHPARPPQPAPTHAVAEASFIARRTAHPTRLRPLVASNTRVRDASPPAWAEQIHYPGPLGDMLAYYAVPRGDGPFAAVVYCHGGFSLAPSDALAVAPLVEAGFAVLVPAWRGENGNPGQPELLWGELDDAVAAIEWLAARPEIDARRIHAIGHSVGGGLAALLSLRPDAALATTASIGGLYVPATFARWAASSTNAKLVRFDPRDRNEVELRVLGPNLRDMVRPHHAYVGRDDRPFVANAEEIGARAAEIGADLVIEFVDGDHETSRDAAIAAFVALLTNAADHS